MKSGDFNAEKARKLANKKTEPVGLKEILKDIKSLAELGFTNGSFLEDDLRLRSRLIRQLRDKGFSVNMSDFNKDHIEVEW